MKYNENEYLDQLTIGDILVLEDKSEHEAVADYEGSETCESCSLNELCDNIHNSFTIGCETDAFHFVKIK